ncbi:MAG: glycosyltransferase family 4 protein [bacterium]
MTDRKNVLIISNSGNRGGMEVHILNILEGLNTDFNFFVVCPEGNIVSEYEKYAKVINLCPKRDIDPIYILKLIRLFKILNISVVHTHELKAGVNGLIAASFAKIPLRISHQHTPISTWKINSIKKKVNTFIYKIAVNKLSSFEIALTSEIKNQKIAEGIKEKKLVVIPNGISLDLFNVSNKLKEKYRVEICEKYGIPPKSLIIGNVSRLTIEKGHTLLIKAIRAFENESKVNNVRFLLAGDGELKDELVRMVSSYDLSDKIIFTGFVSEEEKLKILSSLDIFVFPTLAEGFGIVLIEALAVGLPCVVSDLPVLKEVAGDSVRFFSQGEEKSLKEGIEEIVSDKNLQEDLSKRALLQVKKYKIESFWESYKSLYKI